MSHEWEIEEAERRFERTCPECLVCGEPIKDDFCFCVTTWRTNIERMLSCVHKSCFRYAMRKSDYPSLAVALDEFISDECDAKTPRREPAEFE